MKRFIALLLVLVTLLGLVACGNNTSQPKTPDTDPPAEPVGPELIDIPVVEKKDLNILFIGNSATARNYLSKKIFKGIAAAAGYNVEITLITKGGHLLEEFANVNDEQGKLVEQALTGAKKYDYVVLQEQTTLPAGGQAFMFYRAARDLVARVREHGAVPILYSTWGRKTGSPDLITNGWTNETMTWRVAASYQAIGAELDVAVAYAGLAFYDVYTNHPEIELYDADLAHPSYTGSYLAAATIFTRIFGVDPTTLDCPLELPDPSVAPILMEAAKRAAFQVPQIPEEFVKTT